MVNAKLAYALHNFADRQVRISDISEMVTQLALQDEYSCDHEHTAGAIKHLLNTLHHLRAIKVEADAAEGEGEDEDVVDRSESPRALKPVADPCVYFFERCRKVAKAQNLHFDMEDNWWPEHWPHTADLWDQHELNELATLYVGKESHHREAVLSYLKANHPELLGDKPAEPAS